ncbi:ShlB/FhaC/HecB family hemolysin secretion/activation protein [Nodularia spumigena]|uniref:ShlB/FhaC/HecB family hemolysin secretion/activation protein n=1 Tax=Nodularia spumigena TaxID=70799 RepID=UPI00232B3576|nr:ShlB/FhaC/HecB family hemolysin secretion/activation protein [Nodularia spumigena]MDB9334807.1 ShlB/FhaC/HecB family hemolysin secretion/activation protein [Nodularia spumigena CS-590/01]
MDILLINLNFFVKLKLHLLVLIINNFIFYQIKTEPFLSIFNSSNCLCKQQNLLELSINELLTITKSRRLSQISPKFSIEQFEFVGNTVFSDEYLTKLVEEFTKQDITFSQLLQVEAKINANYLQAGYINSFAVIPANQNIQNRVVKIQIIEGGIEDIRVTGTQRLAKEYIINRLKIAASRPFNTKNLLKSLQLLQLNPLIKNITANLTSGTRREESLLEVAIIEDDSFNLTTFVDNSRAPSVGTWRRGIKISQGNLSGLGDSLNMAYTNTDGSNALDFSYTIPFNPQNGTIQLASGFTRTRVTEPPFDRLDITGDSSYYEISFSHPLLQSANEELGFGITASHQQSKTKLFAEGFPLSRGANDNGETRISAIRLFQNWTKRNPTEVLGLYSQLNLGVGLFDATTNNELPDSHFISWRGQGQYVRSLNRERDMLFVFRADWQLATESLVPLEQFSIGGLSTVRGYRQDALLTDNGILMKTELHFPVLRVSDVKGVLSITPFLDFGIGWNSDNVKLNTNTLIGSGLGLQWQMGEQLKARIDWGIPLTNLKSQDRTLQENGLYFSLESRL